MKTFIKKIFSKEGCKPKISTIFCILIVIGALIVTPWNELFKSRGDVTYETNNFMNENVLFHSNNYDVKVNSVKNFNTIEILNKNKEKEKLEGYFISINLNIKQNENSTLKPHKLDKDDFKLKDHTGVYLEINEFASLVGIDAFDLHYDTREGNHVVSSTDFNTVKAIEDYNYIDCLIEAGKEYNFDIYFKMNKFIDLSKELTVLEIDFYYFANDYRKGTDIILLERKK